MTRTSNDYRTIIPDTPDHDKQLLSEQVSRDIKKFLSQGGKIQKCEPGETQETSRTRKHYGMGAGLTKGALKKKGMKGARRT